MGPSSLLKSSLALVEIGCIDLGVDFQWQVSIERSTFAEVNKQIFVPSAVAICWKAYVR